MAFRGVKNFSKTFKLLSAWVFSFYQSVNIIFFLEDLYNFLVNLKIPLSNFISGRLVN